MLDTRKSGLIQSSPPSMSRTEQYVSEGGPEFKRAVRQRRHTVTDRFSNIISVHEENGEFVQTVPRIVEHPVGGDFSVGDNTVLVVGAVGKGTYQWQKDVVDIVGATESILRLTNLQIADAGLYSCNITNAAGISSSDGATITVV